MLVRPQRDLRQARASRRSERRPTDTPDATRAGERARGSASTSGSRARARTSSAAASAASSRAFERAAAAASGYAPARRSRSRSFPLSANTDYLMQVGARHADLRPARARAERRRRLGRAARPRLRRLLRLRRVRLRAARLGAVRHPLAGAVGDPDRRRRRRSLLGFLLGLPSRRLVGDYLAIVTLFFLQIFLTLLINVDRLNFSASGRSDITGGPNGISDIDPFSFFGCDAARRSTQLLLRRRRRVRRRDDVRSISSTTRARAGPGARCARTTLAAEADEHAGRLAEAARVRLRRRGRGPRRARSSPRCRARSSPSTSTSRPHHGLRDGRSSAARQPRRASSRRDRDQRRARGCCATPDEREPALLLCASCSSSCS